MKADSPSGFHPVFVMNPYYTGIGIARNLHGKGPQVFALSSEKNAPGYKSRFYDGVYDVPNGRDDAEALCNRLLEIRRDHSLPPVLFPTRDLDIMFLHQFRDRLSSSFLIAQPAGDAVPRLLDKAELAKIAGGLSIAVPKTVACTKLEAIQDQRSSFKFPLVLKPRFAYEWRKKGVWEKVGERKAVLVESVEQFDEEYRNLAAVTSEVLIQEYIPGDDTDVVVCCCYIGRGGELLGYYTAKKLIQSPPLLGTACIVELADIPEVVNGSIKLLRACGYVGMAEIEYKHERTTGRHFLIEVNPRHWDQHELGTCAGINLTWLAYSDITGRPLRPTSPSYKRRKCRWIAERELILHLMRRAYRRIASLVSGSGLHGRLEETGKIRFGDLLQILLGHKIFATFHRYDPLPGLLLCSHLAQEVASYFNVFVGRSYSKHRMLEGRDT